MQERNETGVKPPDADNVEPVEIVVDADPNDEKIQNADEAVERAAW